VYNEETSVNSNNESADKEYPIDVSIVVPAYNESENVADTVERIAAAFADRPERWEVVLVDDGSTDDTRAVIARLAQADPRVVLAGYDQNAGRGRALRVGFAKARGEFLVSIDADLSYAPVYILDLLDALYADPEVDFVLGSPYMPGGDTEGVDPRRLLISRLGNKVLQATVNRDVYTYTGIFRAYRRQVLETLELDSDGKEIHLEILSRALGAGYRVKEVPAVLRSRKKGRSKFRFGGTALSHLLFSFNERPILIFGGVGLGLLVSGILAGIYVSILRFQGALTPARPLITVVVVLSLAGLQILSFGFVAVQIGALRREVYKIQRENLLLNRRLLRALSEEGGRVGDGAAPSVGNRREEW
jgi:glycosyltransferase involved in cell wall biosynthesis